VVGKKLQTVAYLECAKEGGPGGLGEKLTLFCYWMSKVWCFRIKKLVKQPKIPS